MRAISKTEFLKLLDEHLPNNAMLCAISTVAGEAYEINEGSITEIFPSIELMFDGEAAEDEVLPNTTHMVLTSWIIG